jgi:hypothetical protein
VSAQPPSSTAKAPVSAKNGTGEGGSFYARNGDVFMTSAWGGYFLSAAECARMLDLWSTPTGDTITDAIRKQMAQELATAVADAEAQNYASAA